MSWVRLFQPCYANVSQMQVSNSKCAFIFSHQLPVYAVLPVYRTKTIQFHQHVLNIPLTFIPNSYFVCGYCFVALFSCCAYSRCAFQSFFTNLVWAPWVCILAIFLHIAFTRVLLVLLLIVELLLNLLKQRVIGTVMHIQFLHKLSTNKKLGILQFISARLSNLSLPQCSLFPFIFLQLLLIGFGLLFFCHFAHVNKLFS